jgi:uncharacterized membrane protein YuzA (DUF378 family)
MATFVVLLTLDAAGIGALVVGLIKGQLPAALAVGYAATAIGGVYFCIFAFLQCQQQRRGAAAHSLY